jgi:hypothetical protein
MKEMVLPEDETKIFNETLVATEEVDNTMETGNRS